MDYLDIRNQRERGQSAWRTVPAPFRPSHNRQLVRIHMKSSRQEQGGSGMRKAAGQRMQGGKAPRAKRRGRPQLGVRERQRLIQLGVSLALFFTVFLGRGVFPEQTSLIRDRLGDIVSRSVDFRAAFAELGEALSGQEPVVEAIGAFCVEVFGVEPSGGALPQDAQSMMSEELKFLGKGPTGYEMACRRLWVEPVKQSMGQAEPVETEPPETEEPLPVGQVAEEIPYDGPALPEGCTMDRLSLGSLSWTDPIQGTITSDFGYRDHPVYGGEQFHEGLDIAAEKGTEIAAFAAGTVEYTGESTTYGLYFQLDHGNGIRSFYAHCDSVLVQKGDTVSAGQAVATVGDTGNATGSHLHFELSVGGIRVNPALYLWQG